MQDARSQARPLPVVGELAEHADRARHRGAIYKGRFHVMNEMNTSIACDIDL